MNTDITTQEGLKQIIDLSREIKNIEDNIRPASDNHLISIKEKRSNLLSYLYSQGLTGELITDAWAEAQSLAKADRLAYLN